MQDLLRVIILILWGKRFVVYGFGGKPMVKLNGGDFQMGINSSDAINGEGPAYMSKVKHFYINRYPVTVKEFQEFIKSKKHFITDAESRGWSYVFKQYASKKMNRNMLRAATHHAPPQDEPWEFFYKKVFVNFMTQNTIG